MSMVPPPLPLHPARRARAALALVAASAAFGCSGSGSGRPDQALGGLVHGEPDPADQPIDVDRAAREVVVLGRALALPHHHVTTALGSHRFRATSTTQVSEAQAVVESLAYQSAIEIDAAGNFHAITDNDQDYGREAFFVGGELFLRPRHAPRFHRRPPTGPDEPARIRDDLFAELAAGFELLAPRIELVDRGPAEVAGRAGRKIALQTAPEPRRPAAESAPGRKWREKVSVAEVSGEVILDAASGAPLAGTLRGTATFARDGRTFTLTLAIDHAVTDVGAAVTVTAPDPALTVASLEHHRDAEEREILLKGIAPPARKAPTPTPDTGEPEPAP
jgi:hypothetical protein